MAGSDGGTSTTSKLTIVGTSSHPYTHIDYHFGKVSLDRQVVDFNVRLMEGYAYHMTCLYLLGFRQRVRQNA
ncbi:PrpF domain-containing protein [Neobacillus cucumis]|uniref:PrpF domain-containing protein n=1 Tax=Neobacillus cucumis TaxID=1740721 RepID=UPI001E2E33ED|nr:PrpF domain-containing protein [Neobacillus cucumis]